ncbi:MAG TPA: M3 family metallopeptidase, partial [Thermoanaerobaculia bacterium]
MTTAIATERPTIPILTAADVTARADEALADAREIFSSIEERSSDAVLDEWDRAATLLEDAFGAISLLNSVHPDKAVRDAADLALIQESSFLTDLFQNEALYERVRSVKPHSIAAKQLQEDLLEAFEDSGVALPPDRRQRFKEISDRLTELAQEFARNIRENDTKITFTPEECRGVPEAWLDRATRDAGGDIVVGFDYPDYIPFMSNAHDEHARKRYYIGYTNRGTPRNLDVLDEIVALRKEIADLYEVPSYAHYVTKRRMVENPDTVLRFLDEVRNVVTEAEVRDLAELSAVKAQLSGMPVETADINRWDMLYFRERLREQRFAIDQESLRKYFPTGPAVEWMLDVSERLYDLRFERATVPAWHDDVMYLDVLDGTTSEFIGGIYLDLYPREGKYKHAAAWPVRGVSSRWGRKPISVLVTNFDRNGLTHDELETLLHEFGHVL